MFTHGEWSWIMLLSGFIAIYHDKLGYGVLFVFLAATERLLDYHFNSEQ